MITKITLSEELIATYPALRVLILIKPSFMVKPCPSTG